jgi:hypothetical protein
LNNAGARKYTAAGHREFRDSEGTDNLRKKRQSETVERETAVPPTKTTASLPAELYGQMWQLIARERGAGRRLTAQTVMVEALREYLKARKKGGAA